MNSFLFNVLTVLVPAVVIPHIINNYRRSPYYRWSFPLVIIYFSFVMFFVPHGGHIFHPVWDGTIVGIVYAVVMGLVIRYKSSV